MGAIDNFLRDIDRLWGTREDTKITLCVLGSTALFLQTGHERGTKDSDIFETNELDERIKGRLKELAGVGSKLHAQHRIYLDIVSRNVPLLPPEPQWNSYDLALDNFVVRVLDVADVVVSKLKRWSSDDRDDVRAMVAGGHVRHVRVRQRLEEVIERYKFDGRADLLPEMAKRLNELERDAFMVAETRFEFPDDIWPGPPKITTTYPAGGEVFTHGDAIQATWTSENIPGGVAVEFRKGPLNDCTDGGVACEAPFCVQYQSVADGSNTGFAPGVVFDPMSFAPGDDWYLCVRDDATVGWGEYFTVQAAPPIDGDGDGDPDSTDCNDLDPTIFTSAVERCGDGIDQDCSGSDTGCPNADADGDGDGDATDCNDGDSSIYTGATDTCGDGIDQDCDALDPVCDADGDADPDATDCNDGDPSIYTGATEICGDGVDQDCVDGDLACPAVDCFGLTNILAGWAPDRQYNDSGTTTAAYTYGSLISPVENVDQVIFQLPFALPAGELRMCVDYEITGLTTGNADSSIILNTYPWTARWVDNRSTPRVFTQSVSTSPRTAPSRRPRSPRSGSGLLRTATS